MENTNNEIIRSIITRALKSADNVLESTEKVTQIASEAIGKDRNDINWSIWKTAQESSNKAKKHVEMLSEMLKKFENNIENKDYCQSNFKQ